MSNSELSRIPEQKTKLPDQRVKYVETAAHLYQQSLEKNDRLMDDLSDANQQIAELKTALEGKEHQVALLESREASGIALKEQALAKAAQYKAVISAIRSIIDQYDEDLA